MATKMPQQIANVQDHSTRRKWWIIGSLVVLTVAVLVWTTPWIIANSNLRNSLLAWFLPADRIHISSQRVELGWTKPLSVRGLEIYLPRDDVRMHIAQVSMPTPWWQVLQKSPHFGQIRLEQPVVDIDMQRLLRRDESPATLALPPLTLQAQIENATVRFHADTSKFPVLEIDDVDALATVTEENGQSILQLGKTRFLDRYPLTPELCDRGLQMVAPIVANVSRVEGTASLDFESLKLPLGGNDRLTDIRGTLSLHEVSTGLKNPVLHDAAAKIANLFQLEMPDQVQLAEDALIRFVVDNDRIHHDSLHFKIPALTGDRIWRSRGSVGFDESLDLEIEVPVPSDKISDSALARLLSAKPIRLRVLGTIRDPTLTAPEDASLLNQLSGALLGTHDQADFETKLDRIEAALEVGEAVIPLWQWGANWLQGE